MGIIQSASYAEVGLKKKHKKNFLWLLEILHH